MNLILQRFSDNTKSSLGLLLHKETKKFLNYTLEDEFRAVKVKGETRIPAGYYELKIRKEETPLTVKHRTAYGQWFKFHIEVTNVPNFQGIYLHAGNDDDDTDGCILGGNSQNNHWTTQGKPLTSSIDGTRRIYELVYPELEAGRKVFLEVRNEDYLFK